MKKYLSDGTVPEDKALAKEMTSMAGEMSVSSDGKLWIMNENETLEV